MRYQFFKDKNGKYILFIIALVSLMVSFGCTYSSKTSKNKVNKDKEFTLEESQGVEKKDLEPLDDLTAPMLEQPAEPVKEQLEEDSFGVVEFPSLSSEDEDVLKERVMIDVENTPLHDVIQTLIRGRGFNLILPEKLMGIVSAEFEDITLQDAFDQLLTTYGYTWRLEGKFLKIMKGEPIWIYKPKYIPISRINEEATLGGRGQQGRINSDLSALLKELELMKGPQGRLLINEWAGTITGIGLNPTVIPYLEEYLRIVDVKRKMVLMEASVIKVQLDDSISIGIDWDMAMSDEDAINSWSKGRKIDVSGWSDSFIKGITTQGTAWLGLSNDHIQGMIQAIAKQGKVSIMASSRALTVDGRSAFMRTEQETSFIEDTVTYPGGGQTAFVTSKVQTKRPNLEFSVMPRVTDDGYINLNIYMNAEEVYGYSSGNQQVPLLSRREMTTNARSLDGQTVVIGGLIQESVTEQVHKVPLLGDIPLIGGLFRSTKQDKMKSEIVMFITPHIVDDAKLQQFSNEDRLSLKEMQESDIKGQAPLFKTRY